MLHAVKFSQLLCPANPCNAKPMGHKNTHTSLVFCEHWGQHYNFTPRAFWFSGLLKTPEVASGIGLGSSILPSQNSPQTDKESPVKEGGICLFHNGFLGLPNIVPLFCVRNGPRLLDFTQLFQAIIETLSHRKDCIKKAQYLELNRKEQTKGMQVRGKKLQSLCKSITLKRSLITCLSLSFSCKQLRKTKVSGGVQIAS